MAEVAAHIPAEIYVNVQGDEPLIDPAAIDALVAAMLEDESIQMATPCAAITQPNDIMDPNVVKVVRDFDGNGALFFARADSVGARHRRAAWPRSTGNISGCTAFRRDALLEFPTLAAGRTGAIEQLEQLRWLENGFHIRVVETGVRAVSVDVPADVTGSRKFCDAARVNRVAANGSNYLRAPRVPAEKLI